MPTQITKTKKLRRNAKPKLESRRPKTANPSSLVAVSSFPKVPRKTPVPHSIVEAVCSITDPFCQVAKGAKWPDGNGMSTMSYQIRGHSGATTRTNGGLLFFINPSIAFSRLQSASYAAGNYTMDATYTATPGNSAITGYAQQSRIVTAGIIIRNTLPALSAAGYVIITRRANMPAVSSVVAEGNVYGVETATHPLHAGTEIPVIFRPLGNDARSFADANTNTTAPLNDFDTISIEVVGSTASTSVLSIEYVYNVEFTLNTANAPLQQFLPTTAPINNLFVKVANSAGAALSDLAHTSVKAFAAATLRAVGAKLATLGSPLSTLAGAAAFGTGTIMNVD